MIDPPRWNAGELKRGLEQAVELFRRERLSEPREVYASAFDRYQEQIEKLFDLTGNLIDLEDSAQQIVSSDALLEAFRYLGGPPVSEDDLKTLAGVNSLRPSQLVQQAPNIERILRVILAAIDRRRFPWVEEDREPTDAERKAGIVASAALLAASYTATTRRSMGQRSQEGAVQAALLAAGLTQAKPRRIPHLGLAPQRGEFCRESILGGAKSDFVIRLWDHRTMPVECKVSNSATNSVKRLNREAVGKAEGWISDFGKVQVIPAAVLSGVYKLHNLEDAQGRGLTVFWSHDLRALGEWIKQTKSA